MTAIFRLALLIGLFFSGAVSAAYRDSDTLMISVSGTIEAEPCETGVPESITLGDYPRELLTVAGGNSTTVPFAITLSNCPPATTEVTITFSGPPWPDSPYATVIYANTAVIPAADVGLQLINLDGRPLVNLGNGTRYTVAIDAATHGARLPIAARMYTPTGRVSAGEFTTVVTVNMTWQ
ncbi:MAG: fimbrial protein [Scandinavium sp.]|uniref:fimbrial protein n=1 Tax=Scandinavium sp. TaxID=2830653 RepID=UPI003F2C8F9A